MELSDFLLLNKSRFAVEPYEVNQIAIEQEELLFNEFLNQYPESQHKDIRERLEYVRSYVLKFPDYDGDDLFLSEDAFNHYKWREQKMVKTKLSETAFLNFNIMQEAINELGLSPKPTFEFILYLWNILRDWLNKGITETMDERINRMMTAMAEKPESEVSFDFKVGKNHFKFNNQDFIRALVANYRNSDINAGGLVETVYPKKREVDYYLLRTLLSHLPIKLKKQKKGTYTQAERTFGLCVLWMIGYIHPKKGDDPSIYCCPHGNVFFDQLMRNFAKYEVPPITPRFGNISR